MTIPLKAVVVFWLHSVGFHLEQFFSVRVFVLAREAPEQIPPSCVREESADLSFVVRSLFTAATLPHWFLHGKKTHHFLHLYFLFANEDLLLDVPFNSKLPLT